MGLVLLTQRSALCGEGRSGEPWQRWWGSTLGTVIASKSLPADMQFRAYRVFVTKEEVIYLLDNLAARPRILCINPAESLEPVVVAQLQTEGPSFLTDLFVTDGGTIYVAERDQRKVLAFHPSSATFTEVLQCSDGLHPQALLVQDRSLYVSMVRLPGAWRDLDGEGLPIFLTSRASASVKKKSCRLAASRGHWSRATVLWF